MTQKEEILPKIRVDEYAQRQLSILKSQSAFHKIKLPGRLFHLFFWLILTSAGIYFSKTFGNVIFLTGVLNYLILLFFRIKNNFQRHRKIISDTNHEPAEWPTFSIIFPLKGEDNVIHQTIKSIQALDYPTSLLQVIVVVEKSDELTQNSLSQVELPDYFQVLLIPTLPPYTKGRALLYALEAVTGKFLTVYDAESRPEPMQLKKAAICLLNSTEEICCQAKIRISNKSQNWITRNFATEYYEWYEHHLYKLSAKGLPFGLGGNSFYISKENMVKAGSWDPFNVTEDVDLSVRLIRNGIKFCIFDSYTDENCPETFSNWLNQRTRWNKGLFITQLVHLRKTFLNKEFGFVGWFSFWLRMFCGTCLPFYNIYITTYILFAYKQFSFSFTFSIVLWLLFGINLLISVLINAINYKKLDIKQSLFITLSDVFRYLFLQIFAGVTSFWEYFISPLKWNKTIHLETEFVDTQPNANLISSK